MTIGTIGATNPYPDAPHWNSLEVGAQFMDFVTVSLQKRGLYIQPFTSKKYQYDKGESLQGWEVKFDAGMTKYGHLSIEIAEKSARANSSWVKSGIYRNDNTVLYIQGNYEYFYIFIKKQLIALHERGATEHEYNGTIKKFYVEFPMADRIGIKVFP